MAKAPQTLSLKEQRFVDNLFGKSEGNATDAAAEAGYGNNRASSKQLGYRLLTKVHIQKAIATRGRAERKRNIADADERDEVLTAILREAKKLNTRIQAIKELNKCTGRHSIKHLHSGKVTLEQILGAARQPRA